MVTGRRLYLPLPPPPLSMYNILSSHHQSDICLSMGGRNQRPQSTLWALMSSSADLASQERLLLPLTRAPGLLAPSGTSPSHTICLALSSDPSPSPFSLHLPSSAPSSAREPLGSALAQEPPPPPSPLIWTSVGGGVPACSVLVFSLPKGWICPCPRPRPGPFPHHLTVLCSFMCVHAYACVYACVWHLLASYSRTGRSPKSGPESSLLCPSDRYPQCGA